MSPKGQAMQMAPELARATRGRLAVTRGSHRRATLMAAMTGFAAERGWQSVPVELLCERSGMSKRTFYEVFSDREECFVAAVQRAVDDIAGQVRAAVGAIDGAAADQVGRALATLLYELRGPSPPRMAAGRRGGQRERQGAPAARPGAGAAGGGHRRRRRGRGASDGRRRGRRDRGSLVYRHLTGPDPETAMTALGAPVAFLVFAPLEGRHAALERAEAIAAAAAAMETLPASVPLAEELAPGLKLTRLTEATILYLADHPRARCGRRGRRRRARQPDEPPPAPAGAGRCRTRQPRRPHQRVGADAAGPAVRDPAARRLEQDDELSR